MRFAGETTHHQGQALGGCNNITPQKKMECLVQRGLALTWITGRKLKESKFLLTVR
jgi:hypothetical protein